MVPGLPPKMIFVRFPSFRSLEQPGQLASCNSFCGNDNPALGPCGSVQRSEGLSLFAFQFLA